ncbi:APC family permease [Clostridiaceae bacterium 35-E11]
MGQLKKELTLSQVISMAAGGMIAAWMVEMIYWFELSGSGSLWALLTTGILVLPLGLVYSEMSSMLPFAGGGNVWISNAFNWDIGWYFNWTLYLMYILAMPTVAYGIVTMSNYFYPLSFMQVKIISLFILLTWFVISYMRVKVLGKVQNILFWLMVAVCVYVGVSFITSPQWSYDTLTPWFPKGFSGFSAAVGILIFKFIGFDMIPQLAEEANFPRKSQWKAYAGAIGLTFFVYALAIISNGGIVSVEWITQTDIIDPRVADLIGKHHLAVLIVVIGILGTVTTLSGFWLSAARNLYGAAKQRQLPAAFGKLNKNGQPIYGNLAVGIFSIYFTIFAPEAWVEYIYTVYAFIAGLVYCMVSLSFLRIRKKYPDWERPFKVKYGILIGTLSLLFTLWIIGASISEIAPNALVILGGYFGVGVVLHLYARHMQKVKPKEWTPIILTPDDIEVKETA